VKFLVTGLGNPGFDYTNTRHNIGFKVLDSIAESMSQDFEICRYGLISKIKHKGKTLILLKPNTFMNLSGKAVKYWLDKEKILSQNCLIVTDDLALNFGKLRLRAKGSHAGHNGLKNISEILGNNIFPRLRFGIGNDFPKGYQTDYVLGKWDNNQLESIDENIEKAKQIIFSFCTIGIDMTMNNLN
jgi:PTH1 family peptidyl-tRNA hydrolase